MAVARFDHDLVVLGAGAAGLFAATEAAGLGRRVLLIEKMKKPGIKILASGGSRCNVTSTLPIRELGRWFGRQGERFLRYALHECGPDQVRELLADEGVATAEHPLEKVFPVSGRAGDVLRAFLHRLDRAGVELAVDEGILAIEALEGGGFRIRSTRRQIEAARVVVTVGGRSYPKAGTTGDGYAWLERLGHRIVSPRPALVPLVIEEAWLRSLTGIAVEDVVVEAVDDRGRPTFTRRRPLLFTHRGLSGPGPMDVSGRLLPGPDGRRRLRLDWLPEIDATELDARFKAAAARRQPIQQLLPASFPRRLAAAFLSAAGIPAERSSSELRREERQNLVTALKRMLLVVTADEGWDKAEVTAGGVDLDEIDPTTMESRRLPGLFVAGELLDLDGPIGGFNFQAAFATGTVAGRAAARSGD